MRGIETVSSNLSAIHVLKTHRTYFDDIISGRKNFELRQYTAQADGGIARDFQVGDKVILFPVGHPEESVSRTIIYVLKDTDVQALGCPLKDGWCIIGLSDG